MHVDDDERVARCGEEEERRRPVVVVVANGFLFHDGEARDARHGEFLLFCPFDVIASLLQFLLHLFSFLFAFISALLQCDDVGFDGEEIAWDDEFPVFVAFPVVEPKDIIGHDLQAALRRWRTEVDGEEVPQRTDAAEQSEERNPNHARSADEAKQSHAEHGSQGKGEGEAGEPQDFEVFGRVNPNACGASPKHQDRNPREDSEDMSQGGRFLVSFFH